MSYARDGIGENPYEHLYFLKETKWRSMALMEAMRDTIEPGMSVLDVGCGALGVLSVVAAKLGAKKVVAIDIESIGFARKIAEANNVDVEFYQHDGNELELKDKFDLIIGMVWDNNPWDNRSKMELCHRVYHRHRHANTILLPNRVSYYATAMGFNQEDFTDEVDNDVRLVEKDYGIDLSPLRDVQSMSFKRYLHLANRSTWDTLNSRKEIEFKSLSNFPSFGEYNILDDKLESYPNKIKFRIIEQGFMNSICWNQKIFYKDLLIRMIESRSKVLNPHPVSPGDIVTVGIPHPWKQNGAVVIMETTNVES